VNISISLLPKLKDGVVKSKVIIKVVSVKSESVTNDVPEGVF
jgi:hypothetical protein